MEKRNKVGAPERGAELKRTRRDLTHAARSKESASTSYIPYAHTVGAAGTGRRFRASVILLLAILCFGLIRAPSTSFTLILLAFTALIGLQAILRLLATLCSKDVFDIPPSEPLFRRSSHQDWPLYTVLIPLKDEAHMVGGLISTMSALEYPKDRLQIIFITEEDDPRTRAAVAAALKPPFEHVIVPRHNTSAPRTKPHALNTAMTKARGDIITIYDAEDAPHPQQLKIAIHAFERHPNWGALQAPLDYFNTGDSWLAAQFGLEYAAQFHVWIPLMVRLGLPFPLGGTSNHIRRTALNDIRQDMFWDSYNVTEDADLSFRLSAQGWDIGYITPPTQEEAVSRLKPWTHQRTRWMKGFMQSWRVHMDKPLAPRNWRGLKRQATLQLTLGSVLLAGFLHAPICLGFLFWIALSVITRGAVTLPPLMGLSLCLGYGSGILIGAIGALRAGKPKLLLQLPFMPLYWMCLFVPTYKAAYEYIRKPYFWAKTTHGIAAHPPSASLSRTPPPSIPVPLHQPIKTNAIAEKRKVPLHWASLKPSADILDKAAE